MKIIPRCKSGEKSSVTSQGRWIPCCAFPEYGEEAERSVIASDDFLLKNNPDPNLHNHPKFKQWIEGVETDPQSYALSLCWRRCSEHSHQMEKLYASNWAMEQQFRITDSEQLEQFLKENDLDGK